MDVQLTDLLSAWGRGDQAAFNQAYEIAHAELKRIARNVLRSQDRGCLLQTTALVNEAYLRLVGQSGTNWQGRVHFLAVAARVMRSIVIDYARQENAAKRGGGQRRVELADVSLGVETNADLLLLDEALEKLLHVDERKLRVVEMKFFSGMEIEEIALVLNCAPATVKRDWTFARAWLLKRLSFA
jgi:RNA polymerase sigma factor (TIGR02999 family)